VILSVLIPIVFITFLLIISMNMGLWNFVNPEIQFFFKRDSRNLNIRKRIEPSDAIPMHFVHLTDIHINDPEKTDGEKRKKEAKSREEDFRRLVKTIEHVIEPRGVFVTGDLTDGQVWHWWNESNKGNLTPFEQKISPYLAVQSERQWKTYEKIIRGGYNIQDPFITTDCPKELNDEITWFDIRGNHDAFHVSSEYAKENYYRQFSIHGGKCTSETKKIYEVTYTRPQPIHFIFLDLSPIPGPPAPYNFFGVISQETLELFEEKLKRLRKDPNVPIIVLGHYPSSYVTYQSYFKPLYNPLQQIMEQYNVTLYLSGHLHDFLGLIPDLTINHQKLSEHESSDFKKNRRYRLLSYDSGKMLSISNHKLSDDKPLFHVTSHPSARIKNPDIHLNRFRFFLFFKNPKQKKDYMRDEAPLFDVRLQGKSCKIHSLKKVGGGYFFDYALPTSSILNDTIVLIRDGQALFEYEPFERTKTLPNIWGQIVLLNYWDKAYPISIGCLTVFGFLYIIETSNHILPHSIKLLFLLYGLGINGILPLFIGNLISVPLKRMGMAFSWGLIYFPEGYSLPQIISDMVSRFIYSLSHLYPFEMDILSMTSTEILDYPIIYTADAYHIYIVPSMLFFFLPMIALVKWIQLYHGKQPSHVSWIWKSMWIAYVLCLAYLYHKCVWGMHVRKYSIFSLVLGPTIGWFPILIYFYYLSVFLFSF